MEIVEPVAGPLAFLVLALLAGLVAALNLYRRPGIPLTLLNVGAAVFLVVLGCFVALAGLGLDATTARGAALALGTAIAWAEPD